jgi:hypothetical protein
MKVTTRHLEARVKYTIPSTDETHAETHTN